MLILPALELVGLPTSVGLDPRSLGEWLFGSGLRIGLIMLLELPSCAIASLIVARFEQDVIEAAGLRIRSSASARARSAS